MNYLFASCFQKQEERCNSNHMMNIFAQEHIQIYNNYLRYAIYVMQLHSLKLGQAEMSRDSLKIEAKTGPRRWLSKSETD
jgi:hypothetical protein